LSITGQETVLHSFTGTDGEDPEGELLAVNGTFYGTTYLGGSNGDGKESIAYDLGNGTDGKDPDLFTLTPFDGRLYGTTALGGPHGQGVVFVIFPGGVARTMYNVGDHLTDGKSQAAGVVAYRNALYGTSFAGGAGGQGTIYRVSKGGGETVLYAFTGNDGGGSLSRLVGQDCVPIHTVM
jgi:uncharacterized repeat protein (TIGR03803 family)